MFYAQLWENTALMRIEKNLEEIAMKGDDVRAADQEVGADHLEDVARNAEEDHVAGTTDVTEAETDIIGVAETEFRDIEDSIVVRGGLTLISHLWYNTLRRFLSSYIHAVF